MKKLIQKCKKNERIILALALLAVTIVWNIFFLKDLRRSVLINEICTSNIACCEDDKGDYPDWIELYNPTQDSIDLSGYILNKGNDLNEIKYVIPDGTVLPPDTFFLLNPGFSLSSAGCTVNLLDNNYHRIDRVTVPRLRYDTVFARIEDGVSKWEVKEPTPGYSNSDGARLEPYIDGSVEASVGSGFYEDEFDLTLKSTGFGRSIYYTTDGSDPVKNGVLYDRPIRIYDRSSDKNKYCVIPEVSTQYLDNEAALPSFPVDKCMVVRTAARDMLGRFTDVSTYTYFVGFDNKNAYNNMAVVAVAADPDDLFSYESGIMVLGHKYDEFVAAGEPEEYEGANANFTVKGRKGERPVSLEVFDTDRRSSIKTCAGIRIKGLSSRWDIQKSFSLFFRKGYGKNYKESFEVGGEQFTLHSFALDKCGQDTSTKMVDTIMEECMRDTGCATLRRVPCCVFLNGEYWGFYWLSERFDRSLISDRYGVDIEDVEFDDENDPYMSDTAWEEEFFDRKSLLEYYAGNIIVAHEGDWPDYNVLFWRTTEDRGEGYADGKLRPVIFDMNSRSMSDPEYDSIGFLLDQYYPFFNLFDSDEEFAEDLAIEIDEMCANEFEKKKVLKRIDELYNVMFDQMVLDRMRYTDCSEQEAVESFDKSVDDIRSFFQNRWTYLDQQKRSLK